MRTCLSKSPSSLRRRRTLVLELPFQQGLLRSYPRATIFGYLFISRPTSVFYRQVRRLLVSHHDRLSPWLLRLLARTTWTRTHLSRLRSPRRSFSRGLPSWQPVNEPHDQKCDWMGAASHALSISADLAISAWIEAVGMVSPTILGGMII